MKVSARVHVLGPLSAYRAGFAAMLSDRGYTDLSLANQLRLAAHFSRWLEKRHLNAQDLTPDLVDRYLAGRRRTRAHLTSRRALAPLLECLGLAALVAPQPRRCDGVLARYSVYLVEERTLTPPVRARYEATADTLLRGRDPASMTPQDVISFVRGLGGGPGLAIELSALRAVLRYLHISGETSVPLVSVVPSMPGWRKTSLPKGLAAPQVRAVLASADRRTTTGRRDYAVLLLMLRLGLRACEVAALTLDDVDWVIGEIVVHGKGGGLSRLPLPTDVGEALAGWLRRRRRDLAIRALFVTSRAPYRPTSAQVIRGIGARALRSAGVSVGGGHRLRHTAATQMLRRGASLSEIAHVLRHRHVDTTAIYAKVDRTTLRGVVQPWPTGYEYEHAALRKLAQPWPGGVL